METWILDSENSSVNGKWQKASSFLRQGFLTVRCMRSIDIHFYELGVSIHITIFFLIIKLHTHAHTHTHTFTYTYRHTHKDR